MFTSLHNFSNAPCLCAKKICVHRSCHCDPFAPRRTLLCRTVRKPAPGAGDPHALTVPVPHPQVAKEFPDVPYDDQLIDGFMYKLTHRPTQYDVVVAPNTWANIISNGGAPLVGCVPLLRPIFLLRFPFGALVHAVTWHAHPSPAARVRLRCVFLLPFFLFFKTAC